MNKKELIKEVKNRIPIIRKGYNKFKDIVPEANILLLDDSILLIKILDYLQTIEEPEERKCTKCNIELDMMDNGQLFCTKCLKLYK